jgi:hypothetical protein
MEGILLEPSANDVKITPLFRCLYSLTQNAVVQNEKCRDLEPASYLIRDLKKRCKDSSVILWWCKRAGETDEGTNYGAAKSEKMHLKRKMEFISKT